MAGSSEERVRNKPMCCWKGNGGEIEEGGGNREGNDEGEKKNEK